MRSFRGELIVDAKKHGLHAERSLVLAALLKPSVHTCRENTPHDASGKYLGEG
jgi:hypothetical protein